MITQRKIENIRKILSEIPGAELKIETSDHDEKTYQTLCDHNAEVLTKTVCSFFENDFQITEKNIDFVKDCLLHYSSDKTSIELGRFLNLNSFMSHKSAALECLIDLGADVNTVLTKEWRSTLFVAAATQMPDIIISKLLQQGAKSEVELKEQNVEMTPMLMAALHSNLSTVSLLVAKFPQQVKATLASLEILYKQANQDQPLSFLSRDGASQVFPLMEMSHKDTKKIAYDFEKIFDAKHKIKAAEFNLSRRTYAFTAFDEKAMIYIIDKRFKTAKTVQDCIRLFQEFYIDGYINQRINPFADTARFLFRVPPYVNQKRHLIQTAQQKICDLILESDNHALCKDMLKHEIFDSKHKIGGVDDVYRNKLITHAEKSFFVAEVKI